MYHDLYSTRPKQLLFLFVVLPCLVPLVRGDEPNPSAPLPPGYNLVYSNDFEDPLALDRFQCTDPTAWRHSNRGKPGGAVELFKVSNYKYKVRSPLSIGLIDGLVFGDFVLEVDLQQIGVESGHRDMCLFFGFQDRSHFYYVHIASKADKAAHNVFIVNDQPRLRFATKTTKGANWGRNVWHKVRLERIAGTVKIFFDDMKEPIMVAEDKTFTEGYVGVGSFDNEGVVDNVRIWAPSVKVVKRAEIFKEGQPK